MNTARRKFDIANMLRDSNEFATPRYTIARRQYRGNTHNTLTLFMPARVLMMMVPQGQQRSDERRPDKGE